MNNLPATSEEGVYMELHPARVIWSSLHSLQSYLLRKWTITSYQYYMVVYGLDSDNAKHRGTSYTSGQIKLHFPWEPVNIQNVFSREVMIEASSPDSQDSYQVFSRVVLQYIPIRNFYDISGICQTFERRQHLHNCSELLLVLVMELYSNHHLQTAKCFLGPY